MENQIKKIQEWIKEKVEHTNTKGVVVGLSGGIDSAVIACLATAALGADKVIGVLLPCDSSEDSITDANKIVTQLGIKAYKLDLTNKFKTFKNLFGEETLPFVNANMKSRLRMCSLYAFANQFNLLVCGTTNKTESLTGYFTKYGDGGVDIEPILNVYKTDVYKMASLLNVPESIINKKPTADLGTYASDEDEFSAIVKEPITYEEIDNIFKHLIDGEDVDISLYSKEKVKGVLDLMEKSSHKRLMPEGFEEF